MTENLHALLKDKYPHLFTKPYKPLAIGIHEEIHARHKDEFSLEDIQAYLAGFTQSLAYAGQCLEMGEGSPRYTLDDEPKGVLTHKGLVHAGKCYLRKYRKLEQPSERDKKRFEIAKSYRPVLEVIYGLMDRGMTPEQIHKQRGYPMDLIDKAKRRYRGQASTPQPSAPAPAAKRKITVVLGKK